MPASQLAPLTLASAGRLGDTYNGLSPLNPVQSSSKLCPPQGEAPYLVHKAHVLPAFTVQVTIQTDVCKERPEGKSLWASQEPSTGLWPPPFSFDLLWGWASGSHFQEDIAQRWGHREPPSLGWEKRPWGGSRVRAEAQVKCCPLQEALAEPSLLDVWGTPCTEPRLPWTFLVCPKLPHCPGMAQ